MSFKQSACCRRWVTHCVLSISKDKIENWKRSISRQQWSATVINKDVFSGPLTTNGILDQNWQNSSRAVWRGSHLGSSWKPSGAVPGLFHVDETSIVGLSGQGNGGSRRRPKAHASCGLESSLPPAITQLMIVQTAERETGGNRLGVIPEKSFLAAPVWITQLS